MAPFGAARLTPDAKLLLIQQAEIKPADGGGVAEMHLGPKFWLYNVASGNRVAEFSEEALAGSSSSNHLLCFSGSGKQFFFAVKDTIHMVNLPRGETLRVLETSLSDLPKATCVLADR
jgi:hypothetical protein